MTKEPTLPPPQPGRRPLIDRRLWRRGEVQPSPPPAQSPLPNPCKTIHEELDCLLSAFSLFRPMIPERLDLFGVLFVSPDPDCRHEAPEVTTANLKEICKDYQEEHAASVATPENKGVVDELLDDMERKVKVTDVEYEVCRASATEHSVLVALDASLFGVVTAQGNHERTITASRDVSLTVSNCERYHGYKLQKLLWQNAEFFFTKILEIIDTDFRFRDGQRRMMAIVTEKIIADISISSEASNQRDTGAGVGGPEGTVAFQVGHRVSNTAANNKQISGGIAGIHFLMFPIERLDEFTFRIYSGVTVNAPRREDSANNSSTRNAYEKWYRNGASDDMDANRTSDVNMPNNATRNSTLPPKPAVVLTAEPQREDDAPSSRSENILREQIDGGVISAEDLVDGDTALCRLHLNRIPYVNINLKPTLNEFAMRQVTLALKFQCEAEQDKSIDTIFQSQHRCTALRLFRSALRKRCYGSTVYALEGLGNFYGCSSKAASNERAARAFKFCAVVLRNPSESYRVWLQILMEKARLRYENRPEAVIAQMVATSGPWSWMQVLIRKVSIEAMFNLGNLLRKGAEGVPQDWVRATELYESVIEKGHVKAMVNLGYLLEVGYRGVKRDAVRAVELYESAIEKGDFDAMFNLGNLLQEGAEGVERDAVRAMELYESVIEKGHIKAMANLGYLLQKGDYGVKQDAVRAVEVYESAIEQGDIDSMFNLGKLLQDGAEGVKRDAVRAMELYESAIEKGDIDAIVNFGNLLEEGGEGVERDAVRAMELYESAMEKGETDAMVNLGNLLRKGAEGVERDAVRAMEVYESAIDEGDNIFAMFSLGLLLEEGAEGVERDAVRAMELYEYAIEMDDMKAMVNLGKLLEEGGEGVERDALRAMELYESAIEMGDMKAMVNLGKLLEEGGEGVERDAVRAMELYESAIENGGCKKVPGELSKTRYELLSSISMPSRRVETRMR